MERKLVTKRDVIILISILALALILILIKFLVPQENLYAVITVDGVETQKINLSQVTDEKIITLDNGIKLDLKDHSISFIESDCKDKICVHTGKLSKTGDVAACLPNRTVVSVVSEKSNGVDIITS